MSDMYTLDCDAWSTRQPALLRSGNLAAADIAPIAEQIASAGRIANRERTSRLTVPLHLLNWRFQPERRSRTWERSIDHAVDRIAGRLADTRRLKAKLPAILASAYRTSHRDAATETGLARDIVSRECLWSLEQAMQETR